MPVVNGIETAINIKEILGKKNKAEIPVIFMTGYSDEGNYKDAAKLYPADFIYKPFDKENFCTLLKIYSGVNRCDFIIEVSLVSFGRKIPLLRHYIF